MADFFAKSYTTVSAQTFSIVDEAIKVNEIRDGLIYGRRKGVSPSTSIKQAITQGIVGKSRRYYRKGRDSSYIGLPRVESLSVHEVPISLQQQLESDIGTTAAITSNTYSKSDYLKHYVYSCR